MAHWKAGEEMPEKPRRAGAAGESEEAEKPVKTKTVSSSKGGESSSRSAEKRSAEEEAADLPTKPTKKMSKFGFAIGSQMARKASAISIGLAASKPKETVTTLAPKLFREQQLLMKMKMVSQKKCLQKQR